MWGKAHHCASGGSRPAIVLPAVVTAPCERKPAALAAGAWRVCPLSPHARHGGCATGPGGIKSGQRGGGGMQTHGDVRPLGGIQVVSLALNVPGPAAAARLCRLGAALAKVEPPGGDPLASGCPA